MMKRFVLWLGLFLCMSGSSYAKLHGSFIDGVSLGRAWTGIDAKGQELSAEQMRGKLSLYFFGFTQCPDVCPTTLLNLSEMLALLDEGDREQVRVVFVSVDPERDTPEVLKAYLANFGTYFEGLTGSSAQIKQLATSFRVFYRKIPLEKDAYTMEHSANLFLFDKKGNAKLFYYGDVKPESLASDIKTLLND